MALIRLGGPVSEIRGSVAGNTYSKNRAGHYIRNRTKPIYPGSDSQNQRASQMATMVETWQGLTVAQRDLWDAKTSTNTIGNKVGEQVIPSAFNLYARANLALLITGQSAVVVPPTPLVIDTPYFTIAWANPNGIEITSVNGWAPAYTDYVQIQRAVAIRQSVNAYKGPYDLLYSITGVAARAVPTVIGSNALIGVDNCRCFFRFKVVTDDGAISFAWRQHADVGVRA